MANAKVAANDGTFRRMIGLIRGRVYYNMNSWYDALALLPGFRVNRPFMEQMMGVRAPMSSAPRPTAGSASWRDRAVDGLSLGRAALGLAWHLVVIDRTIARFYRRLDEALGARPPAFGELRLEDLASHYLTLQDRLLKRWDAPLVNDFLAMIFHGALRRMVDRWCGERAASLQNDLLRGEPGMISVEPPRRIRAMAMIATSSPSLVACLCDGSREQIERAMAGCPTLQEPYQTYLADFGDRCLEELKLESPTLRDDPMPLFRSIGLMARRLSNAPAGDSRDDEATVRARAEVEARACLTGRPITRLLFGWVLAQARARLRDRENLRFERTRLFGRVRAIFVEMGRRLHAEGCLDDARDVFWLEVDEVLRFVDGTATTTDLRGLVSVRRAEYRSHVEAAAPGGRFETRGAVHVRNQFQSTAAAQASDAGETRKGHACCAGVVRGRVRVVTDPKNATLEEGDILVAARTDPGWVLLFSAAAGLVVEHGSLLSHSAIVARELGLPAVVSVAGATTWLRDNDMVELDGAAGIVRRLEPANDATADADGARMLFL